MSGKLDKPLDEIVSAQRRTAGRRRSQRRSAGRPTVSAPVGGIQKNTRAIRGTAAKTAPTKPSFINSESKVIVSNLPRDVSEQQIKEYFVQSVGPIKRVDLAYGPNSVSRGIANVTFNKADGASKAFKKLNGLLVDNRPIKIEIVVGAAQVDKVIPPVKTLAERTSQPKSQPKPQPKSAATGKQTNSSAKGGVNKASASRKRGGRSGRPTKKTAEELDSEMADYFVGNGENANGGATAGNDAAMEDEIM